MAIALNLPHCRVVMTEQTQGEGTSETLSRFPLSVDVRAKKPNECRSSSAKGCRVSVKT